MSEGLQSYLSTLKGLKNVKYELRCLFIWFLMLKCYK